MSEIVAIKNESIKVLDGMEIGVMLALNYLCVDNRCIMVNNYFIQRVLFGEATGSQRLNTSITNAINGLEAKGIIDVIGDSSTNIGKPRDTNTNYVISNEKVLVDNSEKDGYTYIDMEWVRKVSGVNLLKVLMAIVSSFDNETKVGCDTVNNYCMDFNMAVGTFCSHINQLEKDGVLYVKRGGKFSIDGVVKSVPSSYGLVDNVAQVDHNHQQMKYGSIMRE